MKDKDKTKSGQHAVSTGELCPRMTRREFISGTLMGAGACLLGGTSLASALAPSAAPPDSVSFVHFTDTHLNPARDYSHCRMIKDSLALLEDAVSSVNTMKNIDFVIFTGDMIDSPNEKLVETFARAANRLQVPWFWSIGNHDVGPGGMKVPKIVEALNKHNPHFSAPAPRYSFTVNGFLFVSMCGAIDNAVTAAARFPEDELRFLDERLRADVSRPAILFQHFPVVYPFKSATHVVLNQQEYLNLINARPNVKAVFSGHYHAARLSERNGVAHVSTPALVQYPNEIRKTTVTRAAQGVKFDFEMIPTRLRNIRESSRAACSSSALLEGKPSDRTASMSVK